MCFENLPIEFDAEGNARLKPGVSNPYAYTVQTPEEREAKLKEIARKN
jgi:hydrogenase large subunit